MKTTIEAQDPVDVLVGRLRAHAEAHEYIANADPEQRQWMEDLYDAANKIERLRADSENLRRVLKAAVRLVCAPAWAGTSDEDCELERVLRECGYVTPNGA